MNQRFYPGSGTLLSAAALLLLSACASSGSSFGGSGGGTGTSPAGGTGGNDGTGSGTAGNNATTTGSAGDVVGSGTGGDPTGGVGGNVNMTGTGGAVGAGGAVGVGGAGGGAGGAAACVNGYKGICHEFYANDNNRNQINYVNQFTSTNPGGIVWTAKVGYTGENSPRTIEIVSNAKAKGAGKALLVSVNKGFEEYDVTDGTKVASVLTQTGGTVTGACRLPDGTTALGMVSFIRIVSATGATVRQFNLPTGP